MNWIQKMMKLVRTKKILTINEMNRYIMKTNIEKEIEDVVLQKSKIEREHGELQKKMRIIMRMIQK